MRIDNVSVMTTARKLSVVAGDRASFEVVIAGGGVAALEAALALRELGGDRIALTLIASDTEFVYRPMAVIEPFRYPPVQRFPLTAIAGDIGAALLNDRLAAVAPSERLVQTDSGVQHRFDALVLGIGGRIRARYEHAITLEDRGSYELLRGVIDDVGRGYVRRLAFVVPPRMAWPLPIYELALFTAKRASEMGVELAVTLLTPEDTPLGVLGDGISRGVSQLLADRGIEVIASARCEVPEVGQVEIASGRRLEVDRVVTLPELYGPAVPGLPEAPDGFIPVDTNCQVRGVERVYAAGDTTDFAIKHGGIAAQQADTAAQAIAALAGAPVEPEKFHPVIHGMLLTGALPRYLRADITGGQPITSEITMQPTGSSPDKIAARYLAPYLNRTFGSGPGRPGSLS